ncbi:MAG: transketolase [Oscillospiraceae bacterium]|jgi:transketolase|nr:transketolase [Oscillospiraceae bacterium]
MQKTYIAALYEIMARDVNVCSLLSDSGTDYDVMLARDFPGRVFNFGIAEQNKIGIAAGMAKMGKIPFVYTTGSFLAYRAYEFIRNDICMQKRNVKMMGMGMGMGMGAWSALGPSHHATEDVAAMRTLPNLTLLCAATPRELTRMLHYAHEKDGPVYIRLGMSGEEELYDDDYHFDVGMLSKLRDGNDYAAFVTGTIAAETVRAVDRLTTAGFSTALYNVGTLKPLDARGVLDAVRGKKMAFAVEEHSMNGGLGGAIAEVISEAGLAVPLARIGLDDCFARGYGTTAEVRAMNGMNADGIASRIIMRIQQLQ